MSVVISSCLLSNAVSNPSVFAMVKSPSSIVSCFVPISVMILVVPTTKSFVIDKSPITLKGKLNGVTTSNVTRFTYAPESGRIPLIPNGKAYVLMDGKSNL